MQALRGPMENLILLLRCWLHADFLPQDPCYEVSAGKNDALPERLPGQVIQVNTYSDKSC